MVQIDWGFDLVVMLAAAFLLGASLCWFLVSAVESKK